MKIYKPLFAVAALLAFTLAAKAECNLSIPATTIIAGSEQTISIHLNNSVSVTAMQFNIKLPNGFTVNNIINEDKENVPGITLSERKKSSHTITSQIQSDGSYTVAILSMRNQVFSGNEGAIVHVSVKTSPTLQSGNYGVAMSNIAISTYGDGGLGETIKQPNFTSTITLNNKSQTDDASAALYIDTTPLIAGTVSPIGINLTNNVDITAVQFNITLPHGVEIETITNEDGEEVPNISLTARKKSRHSISAQKQDDGSYTVVAMSTLNQAFNGNSGTLIEMQLLIPQFATGDMEIALNNIVLVPLIDGVPGVSIRQENFNTPITIENNGNESVDNDNSLTINHTTLEQGKPSFIGLELKNNKEICALQFNITLPQGIDIVKEYNEDDEYVAVIELTERKKSSHELSYKEKEGNNFKIIAFSFSNAAFKGNSGEIIRIKAVADKNVPEGDYSIILSNIILTTPNEEKIEQATHTGTISVSAATNVEDVTTLGLSAEIKGNSIILTGITTNDIVAIYDINGKKIVERVCATRKEIISLGEGYRIITVYRNGEIVLLKKCR